MRGKQNKLKLKMMQKMSKVTKVVHWASLKPQRRLPSEATWIGGLRIFK